MNTTDLIQRLEVEGARLVKCLRDRASHELRWKPNATRWSMLEVIGHLCDEERDDFRARVEMILQGTSPWPPIDPEGAVVAGGWQQRDPAAAIDEFEAERRKSIQWLRGLQGADWTKTYDHREVGTIVIVAHNHPSGDPAPSTEDFDVTRRLRVAEDIIGIPVLDHLVIGSSAARFSSLREQGAWNPT